MAKESKNVKSAETAENAERIEATVQLQVPKKVQKVVEPVYTVSELAASAGNIFGSRYECVTAALKSAGKMECTVSEAKKIVEKFLRREVM